uniref:Secreted protein n=1 Tax=Arundo donax TaxID=35708 RepID=A0A0A9CTJ3_ARUDO
MARCLVVRWWLYLSAVLHPYAKCLHLNNSTEFQLLKFCRSEQWLQLISASSICSFAPMD